MAEHSAKSIPTLLLVHLRYILKTEKLMVLRMRIRCRIDVAPLARFAFASTLPRHESRHMILKAY